MNFNEYQKKAAKYDTGEETVDLTAPAFVEKVLGLSGEAGEAADKVKKIIRDREGKVSDEDKEALEKELGDVLWYLASIARYLGIDFSEVAEKNLEKLESRLQRGKIHGAGDER